MGEEARAGALMVAEAMALHIAFIKGVAESLGEKPKARPPPSRIRR